MVISRAALNAAQGSSAALARPRVNDPQPADMLKLSPGSAPSALTKNEDSIWRPEWNDAAVGASFKYGDDGELQLPAYKIYGADGSVALLYRVGHADGLTTNDRAKSTGSASSTDPASGKDASGAAQETTECKTCSARTYRDGSDDPGVSFKMSGHIGAAESVAKVMSHESEHEARATRGENAGKVFTQKRIHMAQCPECKRMYAAGGETQVIKLTDDEEGLLDTLI